MGRREARPYLQVQRDDAVATVNGRNGLAVDTGLFIVLLRQRCGQIRTDLYGVTGADRIVDMRFVRTVEIDEQIVDAIQRIERDQRVVVMNRIIDQRGGVLLLVARGPYMRQGLVDGITYLDCVAEDMRLMDGKVHGHNRITTVLVRHDVFITAAYP